MVKVMRILLLVGSIGALILLAASCGGDNWVKIEKRGRKVFNSGLWKYCKRSRCKSIDNPEDWMETCRAFAILSVLVVFFGIKFAILSLAFSQIKGFFSSILLFGAAVCMIVALGIYRDKANNFKDHLDPGWSYILGCVGVIGAGATAVIGFLDE